MAMSENLYPLPKGWEWRKLGDVAEYINGMAFKPTDWGNSGLPIIRIQNLNGSDEYNYFSGEVKDRYLVKNGDILISWSASLDVYKWSAGAAVLNQHIFNTKINYDVIDYNFFFYTVKNALKDILQNLHGCAMKHITKGKFENIDIPLPPLEAQKRIVQKLDGLFAKADKAIALLDGSIASASALLPSALNEVFGELSEKWEIKNLSNVVKINSGIALPSIFKDKEQFNGGVIPFYKVAQMNIDAIFMTSAELYFDNEIAKKENIKIFPKGSVLLPKRGGAILTNKKRIMTVDASYDSNIMGLKADNKILNDAFLFIFLESTDLANYVDTTTIPQINNKHIDMMKIPLPPLNIQTEVVAHLDAVRDKSERLIAKLKAQRDELVALKASLLDKAFKGEL